MKTILSIISSMLIATTIVAQDYTDALRFSETFPMGNARFTSMSGAFGAIGGNISGLSINPAGSAIFKNNTFEISPAFLHTKTQNYYRNSYNASFSSSMAIPNIGVVFTHDIEDSDVLISGISIGFAANRQNHFNSIANFNAINNSNSLTDDFVRYANNNIFQNSYTNLAWDTYLIDYDTIQNAYYSDNRWFFNNSVYTQYGQLQDVSYRRSGASKEYLFNIGLDFSEKVFIGANINIESINYSETYEISEKDINNVIENLESFKYIFSYDAIGAGISSDIGIIVAPIKSLRLGLAAHSPIVYTVEENYKGSLQANYDNPIDGINSSLQRQHTGDFIYNFRKPGKFIGSIAYIYKNIAVIGFDYESVNYKFAQFSSNTESFSGKNSEIHTKLKRVNNIKTGAELRYGPLRFRGGLALYENPYESIDFNSWFYRRDVSGGIGISNDDFYIDFSWVKSMKHGQETFYNDIIGNPVQAKSNTYSDNFFLTFGLKF